MTQKEYEMTRNVGIRDLEATQLVTLDDFKELEALQLAHARKAEPARRAAKALGTVLGLALASVFLLAAFLVAHARQEAKPYAVQTMPKGSR